VAKQANPRLVTPQLLAPPQAPAPAAPEPAQVQAPSPHPQSATFAPDQVYATPQPLPAPLVPAQASSEPQGGFSSPERLMDWISSYRKHPSPSRVPAAVHAMQEYGLLADEEKAWFCTGFIAGVLGDNQKNGASLIAKMLPLPDKEQAVIIRAIVYSGRPDWRGRLAKGSPGFAGGTGYAEIDSITVS